MRTSGKERVWRLGAAAGVGAALLAGGCASRAGAEDRPPARAEADAAAQRPAERLMALVESYQPLDPHAPNRWSQAVRTAFLYAGAQKVWAARSERVRAWAEEAAGVLPEDFVLTVLGEAPGGAQVREEVRGLIATLEEQELLRHLHELAGPCRLVAPPPYEGPFAPLVSHETYEQGALKNLAVLCCARMRLSAQDGDEETALRSFASGAGLARAAVGRPMLLGLINAQAIQSRLFTQAQWAVRSARLGAEALDELAGMTRRLTPLPDPALFIEMERIIALDSIDRYFRQRAREETTQARGDEGLGDGGESDGVGGDDAVPPAAPPLPPPITQEEAEAAMNRAFDRALALLRREVDPANGDLQADSEPSIAAPGSGVRLLETDFGGRDRDRLLVALMPPVGPLILSELENRCRRAALLTVIELEKHRLRTGGYPAALGEIGAEALPPDPLRPSGPLGYRQVENGYILYSAGADGEDNGGAKAARARDALARHPRSAGTDFVLVEP